MRLFQRCALLIGLIVISSKIFGEEPDTAPLNPIIRRIGRIQNIDEPDDIRVIYDGEGSCYTLVVIKGELAVWKTNQEGITNPYPLPGLDRRLSNIKSVDFFGTGFAQYATYRSASISGQKLTEAISIIGLDDTGALRFFPAPQLQISGAIDAYTFFAGNDGDVFFLNQGKLTRVSGIISSEQKDQVQLVNFDHEKVIAFEALSDLWNNYQGGWYKTGDHELGEIEFFIIDNEGRIFRENLGRYPEDAKVQLGMTYKGEVFCSIAHSNRVVFVEVKEGAMLPPAVFDLPFSPLYYYPLPGEAGGLAVCGDETASAIYGMPRGMDASLLPERWTGSDGMDELGDFVILGENRIGAIYLQRGLWRVAEGDFEGSLIEDRPLGDLPLGSTFYFADNVEGSAIYFRTPEGLILLYDYQNGIWIKEKTISLPVDVITGDADWDINPMEHPFYHVNRIIPAIASSGLAIIRLDGEESFLIPGTRLAKSLKINGKSYAAAYMDGSLSLYLLEE